MTSQNYTLHLILLECHQEQEMMGMNRTLR